MVSNIITSTVNSQLVTQVLTEIMHALPNQLQIFSPNIFSEAKLSKPDYGIPLRDVTAQIPAGAKKGQDIKVTFLGDAVAKDKVENSPAVSQTISVSTKTLTLNKHKYVAVTEEDVAKYFTNYDGIREYGTIQARAIAKAFELDVISLFTGFSNSLGSGNGSVFSFDTCGDINQQFHLLGIDITNPESEAYVVLDPEHYKDVLLGRDEYQIAGMKGLDQANKGKIIETPHGCKLLRSNFITKTGGAAKMAALTKDAIMVGFGIKPRVQRDYILPDLGTLQIADVHYGVAELRDEAGILLNYDEVNA
jgi:hypothetical protein